MQNPYFHTIKTKSFEWNFLIILHFPSHARNRNWWRQGDPTAKPSVSIARKIICESVRCAGEFNKKFQISVLLHCTNKLLRKYIFSPSNLIIDHILWCFNIYDLLSSRPGDVNVEMMKRQLLIWNFSNLVRK